MSSKTDAMVKLSLVFVISILSFAIGTFVGKKYSDNQHQLAVLEPSSTPRDVASVEEDNSEEAKETKTGTMSDEEIAKLAEEFVTDDKEVPAKEVTHEETKPIEESAVAAEEHAAPAKQPAKKVEAKVVAAPHASPVKQGRVPSSLPKDVAQYSVGKFTVQVASYANEVEAQKMASDLKKKGYSAFYIPASVKGKTWYRVSVGQFATQKEAQSYRTDLMTNAKVGTAIVQKITE